jgi:hypothetical protein
VFRKNLTLLVAYSTLALALTGCAPRDVYTVTHETRPLPARTASEKTALEIAAPDGRRALTMRQLKALRTVRYTTEHIQLKRTFAYEGVLLSDLARTYGLSGRDLRIEAANAYGATIAAEDYERYPIMLAYHADDKPLTFADKGPLTIVFPMHAHARQFSDRRYGQQWVWYVRRIGPS